MVSPYNLLKFSQFTYDKKTPNLPDGWSLHSDSNQYGFESSGYHGLAFINHRTREIVIASSGTSKGENGPEDMIADILSDYEIIQGKIPKQFTDGALPYAQLALDNLSGKLGNYQVYFTGHSLGAVLAETSKVYFDKNIAIKSQAITFDSPGSLPLIKMIDTTIKGPLKDITIYNGAPNLINTCNPQSGKVWQLFAESDKSSLKAISGDYLSLKALAALFEFTSKLHSLTAMSKSFDQKTGFPRDAFVVKEWPVTADKTKNHIIDIHGSVTKTASAVARIMSDEDSSNNDLFDLLMGAGSIIKHTAHLFETANASVEHLGLCGLFGEDSVFCQE